MRRISFENFYVRSGLFTSLSLAGAIVNYALYPVLAHVFNTNNFGDFTAILALSNQITGVLLAFNLTSIYLVKNYPEAEARQKAQIIQKLLIWIFIAASLLLVLCSPLLKQLLHIPDTLSFLVLSLLLLLTVPVTVWTGYLQGHKKLVAVGWFTFLTALFRFVLSITLGHFYGIHGGLLGVLLGTIAGLIALRFIANIQLPGFSALFTSLKLSERTFLRENRVYILISIIIVGLLSILQNIDITLAKVFFSPAIAGAYSGISILSNALYYAAFLLIWIVLPEISPHAPAHNKRLLRTAYLSLTALALVAIVVEIPFRNAFARALLGSAFVAQGNLLVLASLFQLSLVATTLYCYYSLVLRRQQVLLLSCTVFLAAIALPVIVRPSNTRSLISLLLTAVVLGWLVYGATRAVSASNRLTKRRDSLDMPS